MGFNVEMPPELRGTELQQLSQVRSYLFRLAEGLGVALDSMGGTQAATPASTGQVMSARDYNELRSMIVTSEKSLLEHMGKEIPAEVEKQLRRCQESGDFDGNGIDSIVFNDDYSIIFGFTDGTFFYIPPLKGDKGENFKFEIGDVFCTTRSGEAAELLGYGTWEQIATSPVIMWKRTA